MPTLTIVNHELRYIWLQVPKAASMAIMLSIGRQMGYEGNHLGLIREQHGPPMAQISCMHSYFRFAFVRNPLARLYSCWRDKVWCPGQPECDQPFIFERFPGMRAGQPFAEWVSVVAEIPDHDCDQHFASQTSLLCEGDRLVPDFVGRFEHFEPGWEMVAKRIGLPESIPFQPVFSDRPRDDFRWHCRHYDRTTLAVAYQRYREDIQRFGYD